MKKMLIVISILFVCFSIAFAEEDAFLKLDKNKDNKISKKEYREAAAGSFEKLDKNGDSILTKEEIMSSGKTDAEKLVKAVDPQGEGKIVKKKYLEAAEKQFKIIDKNQDGYIDINEFKIYRSSKTAPALLLFTF